MNNIINKIIIFLSLILVSMYSLKGDLLIFSITITISISCLLEYFNNNHLNYIAFILYCISCLLCPEFSYFTPLIAYDLLLSELNYLSLCGFIVLLKNVNYLGYKSLILLFLIYFIAYILKDRSIKSEKVKSDYIFQRDILKEKSINLENKLSELRYRQDEEISIATLNERNRIAREIHDNVGHLLSSSILQIGAIMAITTDDNVKDNLELVSKTLNDGMNSIRLSVHNLRDDSMDLYQQLNKIVSEFTFCNVEFQYEINYNLDIQLKYAIISIVKEALSNVIKHSNANNVKIKLYEHPKIIQLIIFDNGTNKVNLNTNGMGLEGIKQRVENLDGIVSFHTNEGFKIFICFNLNKE